MPERFSFATAQQIEFGPGRIAELPTLAAPFGTSALLVGGGTPARLAPLMALLADAGIATTGVSVPTEPDIVMVESGVAAARSAGCTLVIAVGGGSALDAGKAIAAFCTNDGPISTYLEAVGRGQPITTPPLPLIAIPTTAGTGSEVTRNAVLTVPEHGLKVSVRSPLLLPRVALIDPELMRSMPSAVTATTGLDALTQCIEPLVSPQHTPLTDALCREGIRRAAVALPAAVAHGDDMAAREGMAIASLCGGMALANARLGAVHGIAAPLGGATGAAHGLICGRLLAPVMRANIRALRQHDAASPALGRYADVAHLLTGRPDATPEDGAAWVETLVASLPLPRLPRPDDLPAVVAAAQRASSMQGNPVRLTDAELADLIAGSTA